MIAIHQLVTYGQWLPVTIGPKLMKEFNLGVGKGRGTRTRYNPQVNPTILNEFTTAAMRFGHSMVAGITLLQTFLDFSNQFYKVQLSNSSAKSYSLTAY